MYYFQMGSKTLSQFYAFRYSVTRNLHKRTKACSSKENVDLLLRVYVIKLNISLQKMLCKQTKLVFKRAQYYINHL